MQNSPLTCGKLTAFLSCGECRSRGRIHRPGRVAHVYQADLPRRWRFLMEIRDRKPGVNQSGADLAPHEHARRSCPCIAPSEVRSFNFPSAEYFRDYLTQSLTQPRNIGLQSHLTITQERELRIREQCRVPLSSINHSRLFSAVAIGRKSVRGWLARATNPWWR